MSGEGQPRKRRGQGASAANEQPPSPQLPKELKRQEARSLTADERPETLPPLSLDLGGEEASRDATPGAPQDPPPPLILPS